MRRPFRTGGASGGLAFESAGFEAVPYPLYFTHHMDCAQGRIGRANSLTRYFWEMSRSSRPDRRKLCVRPDRQVFDKRRNAIFHEITWAGVHIGPRARTDPWEPGWRRERLLWLGRADLASPFGRVPAPIIRRDRRLDLRCVQCLLCWSAGALFTLIMRALWPHGLTRHPCPQAHPMPYQRVDRGLKKIPGA